MRAAVLHEHGGTPRCAEFDEPSEPADGVIVEVAAAGLHHLDLHKASGTFYTGPPPLPSVVGSDGVGRLADGRRVYFDKTVAPYGSMCERTVVAPDSMLEVSDGVDDVVAAALGNTGLAAWLALAWRAELRAGETVLVLGATGAVGTIAVQVARLLGAGRVIAVALADERLVPRLRALGPDTVIELGDTDDLTAELRAAAPEGINVTVDLLWGAPGVAAMGAAARFARHVQVGNMAGNDLVLPAPLIRSVLLDVRGFSVAYPPLEAKREAYRRLTEHAARDEITVDIEPVSLEEVAGAWDRQREAAGGPKLVIVPERDGAAAAATEESPPT